MNEVRIFVISTLAASLFAKRHRSLRVQWRACPPSLRSGAGRRAQFAPWQFPLKGCCFASIAKDSKSVIFRERVLEVVRKIPKGSILTYKEAAQRAGRPKAYRAVGNILHNNCNPRIPCHRVVRSDGRAGGYNRGTRLKKKILKQEGIVIKII